MVEIGAIVDAAVSRIESFGIFLVYGSETLFVPLNNVAWLPNPSTLSGFQSGQIVKVLVERLNYKTKVYTASIKHLHPEENPYREFAQQPPGRTFAGKVKMIHHDGVVVDLGKGCSGELPLSEEAKSLEVGSQVQVQITSLELNEQRITLSLVSCQPA